MVFWNIRDYWNNIKPKMISNVSKYIGEQSLKLFSSLGWRQTFNRNKTFEWTFSWQSLQSTSVVHVSTFMTTKLFERFRKPEQKQNHVKGKKNVENAIEKSHFSFSLFVCLLVLFYFPKNIIKEWSSHFFSSYG